MKKLLVMLVLAVLAVSACKSDDAATKDDIRQPTPAADEPAKVEEPAETEEPAEDAADEGAAAAPDDADLEGRFGGIVTDATTVVVTQRQADGDADFGGEPREADAAWIAKFVEAVGPKVPGSEAVPKCLPNYTLVFNGPEGKVAEFGAVCGSAEAVVLVRNGASYAAKNNEAARALLQGLAE